MSRAIAAKTARERANIAAEIIRRGNQATRELSNCLEMGDGDDVLRILWERVRKRPNTRLAANITRYLHAPESHTQPTSQSVDSHD